MLPADKQWLEIRRTEVPKNKPKRTYRQKVCLLCSKNLEYVDYKNVALLKRYVSEKGKIKARRATGMCAKHQRAVAEAIKRARFVAFLPYKREKYR
jgi:small subunit ribosomal protein S18